ncbi:precorrin-8X methylmutase [Spirochaetia bacterium]|nr:precorrin-8X methylmutase [Spirochaetia bacterium]
MNYYLPEEIEKRSMEIIGEELIQRRSRGFGIKRMPLEDTIVKRVIHTTADFDFDDNLIFTNNAALVAYNSLRSGIDVVTDTNMAFSGINKKNLAVYGGKAHCFIADEDIAQEAKKNGTTRAASAVDKAALMGKPLIFAIGNAPTALLRIHELVSQNKLKPVVVIAVPVGFVNVVESKELFLNFDIPCIIAKGRKGGSAVAASIINALLYAKQ